MILDILISRRKKDFKEIPGPEGDSRSEPLEFWLGAIPYLSKKEQFSSFSNIEWKYNSNQKRIQ